MSLYDRDHPAAQDWERYWREKMPSREELARRCDALFQKSRDVIGRCTEIDSYDLAARTADHLAEDERRAEALAAFDARLQEAYMANLREHSRRNGCAL